MYQGTPKGVCRVTPTNNNSSLVRESHQYSTEVSKSTGQTLATPQRPHMAVLQPHTRRASLPNMYAVGGGAYPRFACRSQSTVDHPSPGVGTEYWSRGGDCRWPTVKLFSVKGGSKCGVRDRDAPNLSGGGQAIVLQRCGGGSSAMKNCHANTPRLFRRWCLPCARVEVDQDKRHITTDGKFCFQTVSDRRCTPSMVNSACPSSDAQPTRSRRANVSPLRSKCLLSPVLGAHDDQRQAGLLLPGGALFKTELIQLSGSAAQRGVYQGRSRSLHPLLIA